MQQQTIFATAEPVPTQGERVENDYYPTPEAITRALLDVVPIGGSILEPCAGQCAISRVLQEAVEEPDQVESTDLLDPDADGVIPRDATTRRFWDFWATGDDGKPYRDWTITNPPFSVAEQILPLAWEHSREGVAFLLRLSYLEPTQGRGHWLQAHADHLRFVIPVSPRPRFRRGSGCDSVTCAWFVWRKDWSWAELGIACPFQFVAGWR